jgi:hypothetical protein
LYLSAISVECLNSALKYVTAACFFFTVTDEQQGIDSYISLATQEISCLLWDFWFITMFTRTVQGPVLIRWILTPCLRSILILSSHQCQRVPSLFPYFVSIYRCWIHWSFFTQTHVILFDTKFLLHLRCCHYYCTNHWDNLS